MTSKDRIEKQSIINNEYRCYICGSQRNLELHHCLSASDRKKADQDGLFVALCSTCHRRLHDHGEHKKELQIEAQRAYIREHGREEYFKRYGKFYE